MIVLKRIAENEHGTFGVLIKDNIPLCVTLEDIWAYNKPNISCIPIGDYKVEKYSGTKYKDVWIVKNVPNRSYILIHSGNLDDDTEGCLLCAQHYGKLGKDFGILESKKVFDMLRKELPDKFNLSIRSV